MPILPENAGYKGFPDWQRDVPAFSALLFQEANASNPVPHSTPLLDVSDWPFLNVIEVNSGANWSAFFNWYADESMTQPLGIRNLAFNQVLGLPPQYVLYNRGPFLTIEWITEGNVDLLHSAFIIGSEQGSNNVFQPGGSLLGFSSGITVPASGDVTEDEFDCWGGPAVLYVEDDSMGCTIVIEAYVGGGSWIPISINGPGAVKASYNVTIPLGGWRLHFYNPGIIDATVGCTVTQSATGSL